MTITSIPEVEIRALFEGPGRARDAVDVAIAEAAREIGFLTVCSVPDAVLPDADADRASLLRLFDVRGAAQRRLWKRNFAPENPNLYRGWFPLESGPARSREGFEIGPDIVRPLPEDGEGDLLYEPSVLPQEAQLPGWRRAAARYYAAMVAVGFALLDSLSRSLGISEAIFRDAFRDGISTLRLLRYPGREAADFESAGTRPFCLDWQGERHEVVCGAHVDSGLITILAQCGVDGLQAQAADGAWISVPPRPGSLAVNFGGLLARWTGGAVRATRHRVLARGEERFSVPFFFEPRPDTVIAPLPLDGMEPFAPFQFGDHLWATTTKFPENFGLEHLRPHRAPYRDPFGPAEDAVSAEG